MMAKASPNDSDTLPEPPEKEETEPFTDQNASVVNQNETPHAIKSDKIGKYLIWTLKFVLFVLCSIMFALQATEFAVHLLTYPTVISIAVEKREKFVPPAITVCSVAPVEKNKFCLLYKNKCMRRGDSKLTCGRNPQRCKWNESEIESVFPMNPVMIQDISSRKELEDLSDKGFIYNLPLSGIEGPIPLNSSVGMFVACYTKNGLYSGGMEPQEEIFSKDSGPTWLESRFVRVLDKQTENIKQVALLYIHSPFVGVKFSSEHIIIKPGISYHIHVRMEEENLLEAPYKTDCLDYEKKWRENNHTGHRSQEMCESQCQADFDVSCYGCFNSILPLGITGTLCNLAAKKCSQRKVDSLSLTLKDCKESCKRECKIKKYLYSVEEKYEDHTSSFGLEYTSYDVSIDSPEVKVITHMPQYMDVELISYIGGFSGFWLGVSVFLCGSSLGEILSAFIRCCCKCHRKRKGHADETKLYTSMIAIDTT